MPHTHHGRQELRSNWSDKLTEGTEPGLRTECHTWQRHRSNFHETANTVAETQGQGSMPRAGELEAGASVHTTIQKSEHKEVSGGQ